MSITETTETLTAADGFKLQGFRARPAGAVRGGLIILQEIFGLTEQLKGVVRSYAKEGYDTICPCVYDRIAPGTVVPFSEGERGRDMAYNLALDKVILDIAAAAACVDNPHGVSVLGFCWGGGVGDKGRPQIDGEGVTGDVDKALSRREGGEHQRKG